MSYKAKYIDDDVHFFQFLVRRLFLYQEFMCVFVAGIYIFCFFCQSACSPPNQQVLRRMKGVGE